MGRRLSAREAARLQARAVLDLTAPSPAQLEAGARFIAKPRPAGPVYLHGALGYGRAACLVVAYLIESGTAGSLAEALALVRAAQPRVHLNGAQLDLLSGRYRAGAAAITGSPISRISFVRMARAKSS